VPTFSSFADFGAELNRLGADLTTRDKYEITDAMGRRAKQLAAQAASADLGGDPKFSGWAATLDTRTRHVDNGATLLTPTARAAGPWTVAQFGRNQAFGPAFVGPRLTKTGRVSRARKKRYNGRTKPKYTGDDARTLMEREMPKIAERGVRKAIRRRFD
jgi:hypothetical protein